MIPSIQRVVVGLVVLGAFFAVVQKLWPANPTQPLWRSGARTDLLYWFLTPLVTKAATRFVIYALFAIAAIALGKATVQQWVHPHGLVARQPTWIQAVEVLLMGDLIGYWSHRLFHRRPLWVFHAIHHSSTELDWLSSVRLHPVRPPRTNFLASWWPEPPPRTNFLASWRPGPPPRTNFLASWWPGHEKPPVPVAGAGRRRPKTTAASFEPSSAPSDRP